MKGVRLHPACLKESCFDFAHCRPWVYNRRLKMHRGYLAPWAATRRSTPFEEFYVWFSIVDLFDENKMRWVVSDLDFRSVKHLFKNFPVSLSRNYKGKIFSYITTHPEEAAFYLSPILYKINNHHLTANTTALGRYVASDLCNQEGHKPISLVFF